LESPPSLLSTLYKHNNSKSTSSIISSSHICQKAEGPHMPCTKVHSRINFACAQSVGIVRIAKGIYMPLHATRTGMWEY
jgi:hypothetical protein